MLRYGVVILVALLGLWRNGLTGLILSLIVFGIFMFFVYTAIDGWNSVRNSIPRNTHNTQNQTLNVFTGDNRPGTVTEEEWAGIVEAGRQFQKGLDKPR